MVSEVIVLDDVISFAEDNPPMSSGDVKALDVGFEPVPVPEPVLSDDRSYGAYQGERSLSLARGSFIPPLDRCRYGDADLETWLTAVTDIYSDWVTEPTFLVFDIPVEDVVDVDTLLLKAPKRGNDVYNANLRRRLAGIREAAQGLARVPSSAHGARTNMFLVSLTFGHAEGHTVAAAWETLGKEWNRFISGLRGRYGKVHQVKAIEAQKNGYPHIHALLSFRDVAFPVKIHKSYTGGRDTWRHRDKSVKDAWARRWGRGFADIQGVTDPRKGVGYILKYVSGIGKGRDPHPSPHGGPKIDLLTTAMCWLFKIRQYAVPVVRLDTPLCNSKALSNNTAELGPETDGPRLKFVGIVCLIAYDGRPPDWALHTKGQGDLRAMVFARMRRRREGIK